MSKDNDVAVARLGEFVPTMQPMYATPAEVMEAHDGCTIAEVKYDGHRAQVHRTDGDVKIFTRNGNEMFLQCYPDVVEIAMTLPEGIYDAELVGMKRNHKKCFDDVGSRFRTNNMAQDTFNEFLLSGILDEKPLGLRVFDVLSNNGASLLDLSFRDRKELLEGVYTDAVLPTDAFEVRGTEALEQLLSTVVNDQQEGIVCKNPSSIYVPGKSTIEWVKFKRGETLDLVVLGFYKSDKIDSELPFTSVLVGTYNHVTGMYETMGKVGVTRNGYAADIFPQVRGKMRKTRPKNVSWSEKLEKASFAKHVPMKYIDPTKSVVLEIKAMNINYANNWQSCGLADGKAYSMRIGYVQQIRHDKDPDQVTRSSDVSKLHYMQERCAE